MYKNVFLLCFGVVIGGIVGYCYAKNKYEAIANEEIENMRQYFNEKSNKPNKNIEKKREKKFETKTDDLKNLADLYKPEDISDVDPGYYSNPYPFVEDHPDDGIQDRPYSITPDQFTNEKRNYEKITMYYFEGNDVLTDDMERMTEDINSSIGRENLDKFGEFEEDVAYIRNERLGIDYEVIRQHSTFKPPYMESEDDIY